MAHRIIGDSFASDNPSTFSAVSRKPGPDLVPNGSGHAVACLASALGSTSVTPTA